MSTATASLKEQLDEHYPLTKQQMEQYKQQGFIKLKHVLSPEVIECYGDRITAKVFELNSENRPLEQRGTYGKAFLQISNLWTKDETCKEFVFSRKLARIAAELMGVRGVRMYHDQALYKEAGGGITPWHADQYYWPLANNNTVTAWIPLQATPMSMGPLGFSSGSHRYAKNRDLEISDESEKKISKALLDEGLPLVDEPFDLGEISYHSGWTFHRAGPNTGTVPRKVMTVIYMEDGMKLIQPRYRAHQSDWDNWLPGAKVGEPIASPLNPVLYRS